MDCKEITGKCLASIIECIWWVYEKCGGGPQHCKACGQKKNK